MTPTRILIDTGAIYAFVTRSDPNHTMARAFVQRWLRRRGTFLLVDAVFAETMTLLKVRHGADVAIRVGTELRCNPVYVWYEAAADVDHEAWEVFRKHRDKDWSFTDCGMLVVSRRTGVHGIFAFDRHFLQMTGIERQP